MASRKPQQARDRAQPEVAERSAGSREARQVGGRVRGQHAARGAQEIEARIRRRRAMESAADLRGSYGLRRKGARFRTPWLRYYGVLGAQWPAVDDARCRRAADLAGGRQR